MEDDNGVQRRLEVWREEDERRRKEAVTTPMHAWLLERCYALLEVLMAERGRKALVHLPPEGASLDEIERQALLAALDRCGWVQSDAAKLVGISARVMNYKMNQHDLYAEHPLGGEERVGRYRKKKNLVPKVAKRDLDREAGTGQPPFEPEDGRRD
jgi:hypothetical protein